MDVNLFELHMNALKMENKRLDFALTLMQSFKAIHKISLTSLI